MNRQERRRAEKSGSGAERVALAYARYRAGDLAAAEAGFRAVLASAPEQPDALRLLGELLADAGRYAEAVALLQRLVALRPRDFVAPYSLGNAYRLAGQNAAAMACYRAALALNPGFAGAHHGLGACLRKAERDAEALEHFRQAVRLQPDWAVAWKDLGLALAVLGDLKMAEAAFARAAAMQPDLGDAQRHLAALRRDAGSDAEVAALEARCTDARVPAGERIEMRFTLGQLAERAGRYEAAFAHFVAGNALLRAWPGGGFDRARLTAQVDALIAHFTPEVFAARAGWGNASEAPVFIVGMPRAGSTLFEQIAASHSGVFGAGERFGIGEIAGRIGMLPSERWTPASIGEAAAGYLAGLRASAGGAVRVIDKMPDNIFQLGLVAVLFPAARVMFCEREPRDVAISCYFQNFAEMMGFDTDLGDIAFRIRETARLAAHWRAVLPLRWMDQGYEALLADLEGQARRMIGFLGLDWEPQCLRFHETVRPVRTASWSQVRRPLYQNSAGRWRHYAKQLEGLEF
jgi:Flp pilus assembly protein TadD